MLLSGAQSLDGWLVFEVYLLLTGTLLFDSFENLLQFGLHLDQFVVNGADVRHRMVYISHRSLADFKYFFTFVSIETIWAVTQPFIGVQQLLTLSVVLTGIRSAEG